MDQKWIRVLMILVFSQKPSSEAVEVQRVKEGADVVIRCDPPEKQNIAVWYRILDTSRMEFIGSWTNGIEKVAPIPGFSVQSSDGGALKLKEFKKAVDSGIYTCANFKHSKLIFGKVTRLEGEKIVVPTKAPTVIPTTQPTTTTACACNHKDKKAMESSLFGLCTPTIFAPLAGSCGLLLLLLIIISVYCNRIRTRRCPHHHKRRKPRTMAPEKQMMTNRHV